MCNPLDDKIVFVNVGDSRAILSRKRGKELQICTYDHKPQFFGEMQRILKNNGQLYRVCSNQKTQETEIYYASTRKEFLEIERIPEETHGRIFGPWRAKPGGLSVIILALLLSSHFSLIFLLKIFRYRGLLETSKARKRSSEAPMGLLCQHRRSQFSIIRMI